MRRLMKPFKCMHIIAFLCVSTTTKGLDDYDQQLSTAENVRGRKLDSDHKDFIANRCRLYWRYEYEEQEDMKNERRLECEITFRGLIRRYPLEGLPKEWLDTYGESIVSSESELEAPSLEVNTQNNTIQVLDNIHDASGEGGNYYRSIHLGTKHDYKSDSSSIKIHHHQKDRDMNEQRRLNNLRARGIKKTVVVHVETNDGRAPYTPAQLSNHVFGTYGGRQTNVRSLLSGCSYGKIDIAPSNASGVVNGVFKVKLSNLRSFREDQGLVTNAALDQLRRKFGDDLTREFDHVIICMPRNVRPFIAYAWGNDFLSVYYDTWCGSLSGTVHELGHNIGLSHSGEGDCRPHCEYRDQSGLMGFVYPEGDGPKMCFNAPKSWQLGWYDNRNVAVNPLYSDWDGQLVGVADYGAISNLPKYHVILQLESPSQKIAHYISFNRKTGINAETTEGGDQILITTQGWKYGAPTISNLQAKMIGGEKFVIGNFDNSGKSVVIMVNYIRKVDPVWYADVSVTSRSSVTSAFGNQIGFIPPPTSPPTNRPTRPPTKTPTRSPSLPPTNRPTRPPTKAPTRPLSKPPTRSPTSPPTRSPTKKPTVSPTNVPTVSPTPPPTALPTVTLTSFPTGTPTSSPTDLPSVDPTVSPTYLPSVDPTVSPTDLPSAVPTPSPTKNPSIEPTGLPSSTPSWRPSTEPSVSTNPSQVPSVEPSDNPTVSVLPSISPSGSTQPSSGPSTSSQPSQFPTQLPSIDPTSSPTISTEPSNSPSISSYPSHSPTPLPSMHPSTTPTTSYQPSTSPSKSTGPTSSPSISLDPTNSISPTEAPSLNPTKDQGTKINSIFKLTESMYMPRWAPHRHKDRYNAAERNVN